MCEQAVEPRACLMLHCRRTLHRRDSVARGLGEECLAKVLRAAEVLQGTGNASARKAAQVLLSGVVTAGVVPGWYNVPSMSRSGKVWLCNSRYCPCPVPTGELCYHRVVVSILCV